MTETGERERLDEIQTRINDVVDLLNEHRKDMTCIEAALYMVAIRSLIK
ncbi:MAG: hypothetical protein Q8M94_22530 [Ignavibacteria bacterium]|nr:hypothetical protein [Ignavibacteria bacterium]